MTITWLRSYHYGLWTPVGLLSGIKGREGIAPARFHQGGLLQSVLFSVWNKD